MNVYKNGKPDDKGFCDQYWKGMVWMNGMVSEHVWEKEGGARSVWIC